MKNISKVAAFLTVVIILCTPLLSHAAGPGFGGDVNDGGSCAAPLDGGMSLLIAAGIGYGAKKLARKKKAHSENTAE
jgi:hypothetical protein